MSTKLTTTAERSCWSRSVTRSAKLGAVVLRDELVVAHPDVAQVAALEQVVQKVGFVGVEAVLVLPLVDGKALREAAREVDGQHAAEEGVARERRRGRQDAVVPVALDLEVGVEQPLEEQPLVVAHAVDEEEHDGPLGLFADLAQVRKDEFGQHLVAQDRPVVARLVAVARALDPARVDALDVLGEGDVGLAVLVVQDLAHALVGAFERHVVPDERLVHVGPLAGVEAPADAARQLAEALQVVLLDVRASDAARVQQPLDREQDLLRVDRLDEVVRDVAADGVLHDVLLLGLGDHHDRHLGPVRLDLLERVEPAQAGHLLVQKDDVVARVLGAVDGVGAVGDRLDLVALGLEKEDVGLEKVDLVVGPEDAGHGVRGACAG